MELLTCDLSPWNGGSSQARAKQALPPGCLSHYIIYIYIVITYYNIIGMLVRAPVGTGIIWHLVVHIHVGIFV